MNLKKNIAPYGLLVNLSDQAYGVDLKPSFSWIMASNKKDDFQKAYHILVADNLTDITNKTGNYWDSKEIASKESTNVPYEGKALKADSTYYIKVATLDKDNQKSDFSDYLTFSTQINKWAGLPIWSRDDEDMIFLRKSFNTEKEVESAILSAFASSTEPSQQYVFALKVNGNFIGQGPVKGHNNKHFYNSYNITDSINKGENVLSAILYTTKDKIFLCQITITYKDGTRQIIGSDESFKTLDASKAFGLSRNIGTHYYAYPSEDINSKLFPYGYDQIGFDDSAFSKALIKEFDCKLYPNYTNRVIRFYKKVESIKKIGKDNYLIDIGKAVIGGIKLVLDLDKKYDNTSIRLLYGEEMEDENFVKYKMRTSNTYEEFFTLKEGYQEIENFGMKGFRYINILDCPFDLTRENVYNVSYRQEHKDTDSSFESSNSLLNEIYDFCKYSIIATSQDLYVDSQTRERRNYEGDALINQLSQYGLMRNYTLARFSTEDLYYNFTWPFEYKQMNIMMGLNDYMHTGDISSLRDNYEAIKTKVAGGNSDPDNYLDEKLGLIFNTTKNNQANANLVDWPMSERDSYDFANAYYNTVTNAFHYAAFLSLSQIADLLGYKEDKEKYLSYANTIKDAMNKHLIDKKTGLFIDGLNKDGQKLSHISQHANVFPLALGLVDDSMTKDRILAFVKENGMRTSVYGSQFVLEACYKADGGQVALDLMTSKGIRSWYHLIYNLKATISTEAWDPANKPNMTFSHPWSTSPANIIPNYLFGIKAIEPAFNKFQIKLQAGDLEFAKIKLPTIKGFIEVDYKRDEEIILNVPANTSCNLYLPKDLNLKKVFIDKKEVAFDLIDGYSLIKDIGSGKRLIEFI